MTTSYQQLFSTLTTEGELRLEMKEIEMPTPGENQVVIRVEATPINPSDLGVMFGWADMANAKTAGGIFAGQQKLHEDPFFAFI